MQDKITIADAPDCLNTNDKAMWVLGYQAALATRSTCLHQIQVPSSAEQAAWHAGLDEGRAHTAPAAVAVPDGWKLVPVDLTPEMKREFMDLLMDGIDIYVNRRDQIEIQTDAPRRIWKAVLALAPSAPADALATATGLPAQAVEPSDAELIALNAGECFFSESPSKYPELGHGTQYHGGAPGVIGFARAALALRADPAAYSQKFQQRVQPWMMACFGPEISADRRERNHRFLEEALELVQSCGCTASEAHQLVDYVYGRPWGEPAQEAGGVMVTLAALCLANGLDMHACGETELARIWTKLEAIRAKQAAKPKHSPLPMHVAHTLDDSTLLDAMERQRIAVVPEYEGPWDAEVYNGDEKPNQRGTGSTPREAIRAAIAAQSAAKEGSQG